MELAEYIEKLKALHRQSVDYLPEDYYEAIAQPWFLDIALVKADEYGACWERMGAKAFVVNTSAVFYRWKRLMEKGRRKIDAGMDNCLIDAFGFSMIFHICLNTGLNTQRRLEASDYPGNDDEYLINMVWDKGFYIPQMAYIALRQAYSMWTLTP